MTVVNEYLGLSVEEQANHKILHVLTGIPLVDIMINIDWFTAHFEDRQKTLRIIKDLFNKCDAMKLLLKKHNKLILAVLMTKYDKTCHLHANKAAKQDVSDNKGSLAH